MGYTDFDAKFGTAKFDQSSFDVFGLGVDLPISSSVTPNKYNATMTPENRTATVNVTS